MNVKVITRTHPRASVTEENCALVDFLNVLKARRNFDYQIIFHHELFSEKTQANLALVCLYDDMSINLLEHICDQIECTKILLFQPTMKYLPREEMGNHLNCLTKDKKYLLVTNNIDFLGADHDVNNVIYTDCVDPVYLRQKDSEENPFELVVLDLLEDTQVIYTELCMKAVVPYLNAQKSRKIEKLCPMTILSNLGMSSLKASPESLQENLLTIAGICWDTNRPEFYFGKGNVLLYPAIKSKAFGRWGYLAKHHGMTVRSDMMHGYRIYEGIPLAEAIKLV